MKYTKLLLAVLAAGTASGCVNQSARNEISANNSEATRQMSAASAPLAAANKNSINRHSAVYVGTRSVTNEHGDPLPSRLEKANGIVVNGGPSAISIKEIALLITQQAKIPVVIANDIAAPATGGGAVVQQPTQAPAPQFAAGPIPPGFPMDQALAELQAGQPAGSPGSISAAPAPVSGSMVLNFSGKLSDLLDLIATNFNVNWKYERGKIVIEQTITRSFDVPALPMVTTLGFSLGATQEGSSGAKAQTDVTINVYEELVAALTKLVGDSYSINRSTGIVTVTGAPSTVNRARDYIESLNVRLKDQVALSVKVYAVTVKDDENFALDLKGVFKGAANSLSLTGAGTAGAVTGGGTLGWALVDANSQFNGSDAALQALSNRGDVSVVTTASLTTVNGQPVPLQVGEDRDYVKQVSDSTDPNTGQVTTTFETDTVQTGFALQLMPRIQRNGDVLLQYGVNIKELVGPNNGFEERTIGQNKIQLKRLTQRNFIQNANIPYGQTLVLAGFEQVKTSAQSSGTGHPNFPLLGGNAAASKQREVIVIMITPTVLQ